MKIKRISIYCIIVFMFCQFPLGVSAISSAQKEAIVNGCGLISDSLKDIQRQDAITRDYLGKKFETILSKFIKPLNYKLVDKNIFDENLISNQAEFTQARDTFRNDYTSYQKALEELVNIDCTNSPEEFYKKLVLVRERRAKMSQDVATVKKVAMDNVVLVTVLKGKV